MAKLFRIIDTTTGDEVAGEKDMADSIGFRSVCGCKVSAFLADEDGNVVLEDSCGQTHILPEKFKAVPV